MVADNPITDDAAETLHEILKDMAIRDQIYAREEYNMRERQNKRIREEYKEALKVIDEQKEQLDCKDDMIENLLLEVEQLKKQLQNK